MQSLKAEHWVNATMEQHPPPGHGTPQHRSHVPFRERCKTSREEYSSTILPALAVNKYGLRILLGAGKTQGGGKKTKLSLSWSSHGSQTKPQPHTAVVSRRYRLTEGATLGTGHRAGNTWRGPSWERRDSPRLLR